MPAGTGQSFSPTLAAIDYVRLNLNDPYPNSPTHNGGATLSLTLRAESMFGPVLGTTSPVFLADDTAAIVPFLFPQTIALAPGTTYYLELILQPSDNWGILSAEYNYAGGSGFWGGVAGADDFWFQEGVVIPEPSAVLLALAGGVAFWFRRNCVGRT
jgi:hypothetical protein